MAPKLATGVYWDPSHTTSIRVTAKHFACHGAARVAPRRAAGSNVPRERWGRGCASGMSSCPCIWREETELIVSAKYDFSAYQQDLRRMRTRYYGESRRQLAEETDQTSAQRAQRAQRAQSAQRPGLVVLGTSHKTGTFLLVYLWRLFRDLSLCGATFIHSGYARCGACPPLPASTPLVLLDSHFEGLAACAHWRRASVVMTIREPLALVVSAFEYHQRNMEAHWTGVELPPLSPTPSLLKADGTRVTMDASFLGCAPNRTHLFFANYTTAALDAIQHAAASSHYAWPRDGAVQHGAANGSFSAFLQQAPASVGLLAQLRQSRAEACEMAIAHARTTRSGGLVVRLESFADPAGAIESWDALEERLTGGTGCRIHSPAGVVQARLRALLDSERRSEHASQAVAAAREQWRQLAQRLDRAQLGGWYAQMGALLGYAKGGEGQRGKGGDAVRQVRALCAGLHADSDMPELQP